MPLRPRIVAVDAGAKRVGLATSDPFGMFAQPLGTYHPAEAIRRLRAYHDAEGIATLVVGWPLEFDGSEGAAVDRVRPYLKRLRKALPGLRVVLQDERDSSKRARAALVASGVPRGKRRKAGGRVDAAAACVILEDYLEEHPGGAPPADER